MVCHSLLQWTTFCQTSPPWLSHLGWPHMAWLSFIELDKAVVHVIRLASCLWLCFQSVCPLIPSLSAYCLTWVSLTLDMRYLFTAAPAKCSHHPLPWTWGSSSQLCLCTVVATVLISQKQEKVTLWWGLGIWTFGMCYVKNVPRIEKWEELQVCHD